MSTDLADRELRGHLATALVNAQADMPPVEPNATNPHYKSKFVSLDHLLAKVRPVLNKHGLAVVQFPSVGPGGEPALTTVLLHESGESMTAQMLLLAAKPDPQGQGSALTYARRYALAAVLGISSEADDDGAASSNGAVVDMGDPDIPFGDAPVPEPPLLASDAQKKKLGVLVGRLRDGESLTTEHLWRAVNREPVAGEDGVVHFGPLLQSLTKAEAHSLIDRLENYERHREAAEASV